MRRTFDKIGGGELIDGDEISTVALATAIMIHLRNKGIEQNVGISFSFVPYAA